MDETHAPRTPPTLARLPTGVPARAALPVVSRTNHGRATTVSMLPTVETALTASRARSGRRRVWTGTVAVVSMGGGYHGVKSEQSRRDNATARLDGVEGAAFAVFAAAYRADRAVVTLPVTLCDAPGNGERHSFLACLRGFMTL